VKKADEAKAEAAKWRGMVEGIANLWRDAQIPGTWRAWRDKARRELEGSDETRSS